MSWLTGQLSVVAVLDISLLLVVFLLLGKSTVSLRAALGNWFIWHYAELTEVAEQNKDYQLVKVHARDQRLAGTEDECHSVLGNDNISRQESHLSELLGVHVPPFMQI